MKHSLRPRLLVAFLLISLVPLILLLSINYSSSNQALRKSTQENLVAIAESKASQIERYMQNLQGDIQFFAHIPTLIKSLENLQAPPQELRALLEIFQEKHLFLEILLIDRQGNTLNQRLEPGNILYQLPEMITIADQASTLLEVVMSEFGELDQSKGNHLAFYLAAPIFNRDRLIGTVAIKGSSAALHSVINDFSGLGKTGEVIVVTKVGKYLMSVTPTRLQMSPEPVYQLELASADTGFPLFKALQGSRGTGAMLDYRKMQVLAAWRYLPSFNGGLLVKVDQSEVLLPLKIQQQRALAGGLITVAIVILTSFGVSRSITSPLEILTKVAQQMTQGNLDIRVSIASKDEIGELASTFNRMSDRVAESFHWLEERVIERTADLAKAYDQIEVLNQRLKQENSRLSSELEVARKLQEMILPKEEELREIHHLEIAGFMAPADEVGGDYYDVLSIQDKLLITIGDVTGHGLESGVFMIMAQTAIRTLHVAEEKNYIRFLNVINQTLYENAQRMGSDRTMTLSLLEYEKGQLQLSGQHEEMIVVRCNGLLERIETIDLGFPLGLEENITPFIQRAAVHLEPQDIVVLYTDGIPEAENLFKHQYGVDRLCEIVQQTRHRSAREIREAIIQDVLLFINDHKIFDDMTLLVLKQQ